MLESGKSGTPTPASGSYEEQLERARGLERIASVDAALAAYGELARLDPSRREPLQGLRRLYAERGSWDAVLQVAELEIGLIAQPEERARLLSAMARIWERELGDAEQARQLLVRAGEERKAPRARPAPPPAAPHDEAVSAETLVQRAWLASARGDLQGALSALHDALAADPSDVEALDMLLTVLEGAERYGELSELLERRAALAADDATRAVVLARLGALREAHQTDQAGARFAYERALEADAGNRAARSALVRLYRRSESWPALRALLEAAAGNGAAADRAASSVALGALLEQQFADARGAEAAYQAALRLAPEDAEALEGLRRLHGEASQGAARSSRPSRRSARSEAQPEPSALPAAADAEEGVPDARQRPRGDASELIAELRDELMRCAPDHELALQVELADLLTGSLRGAEALPHARRAAELAPQDAAVLERAIEAAQGAGGGFAVLDLLDDLLATARDLGARARLLARRGDTLCDALGWNEEAAHAWREALENDPRHPGARKRLGAVHA